MEMSLLIMMMSLRCIQGLSLVQLLPPTNMPECFQFSIYCSFFARQYLLTPPSASILSRIKMTIQSTVVDSMPLGCVFLILSSNLYMNFSSSSMICRKRSPTVCELRLLTCIWWYQWVFEAIGPALMFMNSFCMLFWKRSTSPTTIAPHSLHSRYSLTRRQNRWMALIFASPILTQKGHCAGEQAMVLLENLVRRLVELCEDGAYNDQINASLVERVALKKTRNSVRSGIVSDYTSSCMLGRLSYYDYYLFIIFLLCHEHEFEQCMTLFSIYQ